MDDLSALCKSGCSIETGWQELRRSFRSWVRETRGVAPASPGAIVGLASLHSTHGVGGALDDGLDVTAVGAGTDVVGKGVPVYGRRVGMRCLDDLVQDSGTTQVAFMHLEAINRPGGRKPQGSRWWTRNPSSTSSTRTARCSQGRGHHRLSRRSRLSPNALSRTALPGSPCLLRAAGRGFRRRICSCRQRPFKCIRSSESMGAEMVHAKDLLRSLVHRASGCRGNLACSPEDCTGFEAARSLRAPEYFRSSASRLSIE